MTPPSKAIREDYPGYRRFLDNPKVIEHRQIGAKKSLGRGGRPRAIGTSGLTYDKIQGSKAFQIEVSLEDRSHYMLKVYADYFGTGPCFRFDSRGRAHLNPEDGDGLRKRQVPAPHFHQFNEDGIEVAFRTDKLEDEECVRRIVANLTEGIRHFCDVATLACDGNVPPELVFDEGELDLSSDDPLNGVPFK